MIRTILHSKIHRATITQAELDYVGSITIDEDLMEAAGIVEYEKVLIADVQNGGRFETYTIAGPKGSGVICVNGAAAQLVNVGDKVIIMAFGEVDIPLHTDITKTIFEPTVVLVDEKNRVSKIAHYEKHGELAE
ncbi:MAG: aspartate 1-decarboxylase [Candidatus Ancillula sp.]|jgi:aspartate 1-decarboxylase|nr:aspartate 1-decarboxylase [Candidatus Ancillula sp.]